MIIVALYYLGPRYALTVNVVRVLIAGLLFSGVFGAAYSMAGALLSFLVMVLLKKTGWFSVTGVSIAGGVAHNLGQILVASFLVSNLKMFAYFPVLIFSGVASGAAIGIISWLILQRLPRSWFRLDSGTAVLGRFQSRSYGFGAFHPYLCEG